MSENEILINQLFSGGYLAEGGNIGHEIINLFQDDLGDRYLYVTKNGCVTGHQVESVIFVRRINDKTVEVIAIGVGLSPVDPESALKLTYGGALLPNIFKSNIYNGEKDEFSGNVTFKAEQVLVPSGTQRIMITTSSETTLPESAFVQKIDSVSENIANTSLRRYYPQKKDPDAYEQLSSLINRPGLWESASDVGQLVADGSLYSQRPSFLEIIGKENDELVFSNLLAYFFDYSHEAFRRFASETLKVETMSLNFSITREKSASKKGTSRGRIDLWIEGDNDIILIENKIKSGINGLDENGQSQLSHYHSFAQEEAISRNKNLHLFLLAPDYNNISLKEYGQEGIYQSISYSSVYDFFTKNASSYLSDPFFPEFLRGLELQTMTMSELNFKTMKSRFAMKIAQAQ